MEDVRKTALVDKILAHAAEARPAKTSETYDAARHRLLAMSFAELDALAQKIADQRSDTIYPEILRQLNPDIPVPQSIRAAARGSKHLDQNAG